MATNPALSFDPHAFAGRRSQPVHAEWQAGEIETTGLAYEDIRRMSSFTGVRPVYRHKPLPPFLYNKVQLRELITHFLERRAGYRTPQEGTHAERLARAKAVLAARVPRLTEVLTNLCHEYVAVKKQDPSNPRVRTLQSEISNTDTQLLIINKAEVLVAGVIFRSYNLGENSVEVGRALGLRPPHVRAILHKLNRMWNKMPERAAAAYACAERKAAREAAAATRRAAGDAKRTARREAKAAHKAAATKCKGAQRKATPEAAILRAAAEHKAVREAIVAAAAARHKSIREAIATRNAEKASAHQVAIDRYKAGVPVAECGLSHSSLYWTLRRAGVPLRTKAKAATVVTA